jgi:hypothetical protein
MCRTTDKGSSVLALHQHRRTRRLLATATALAAGLVGLTATTAQAATAPTTGSPAGNVDVVVAVPGGVQLKGWTWDPDTTAAVTVEITSSAGKVTTVANQLRADVAKIYPTAGSYRGWTITVPTGSGAQTVCPVAKNVGAGSDRTWSCRTVTVADRSPSGSLDLVEATTTGVRVAGRATDPDTTGPVDVRVTVGGTSRTLGATAAAGFAGEVAAAPGTYEACATAVNVLHGTDTALGCRSVTVRDHSPTGALDPATDAGTGLRVSGWASDIDTTSPVTVRLAVTGTATTADVAAGTVRSDGTRGFSTVLALAPGAYQVCATALNTGAGADRALGCVDGTALDHSPVGAADASTPTATGVQVSGWATDVDTTAPVAVRVTVGSTTTTLSAGTVRADGRPGYTGQVAAVPGTYQVCTTLVNAGAGADKALGCTSVTVAAPAPTVPGPTTTGVPAGTTLRVHEGDLTITTPGTVIDGLDIRGYVRVKAANVVIKNSIIRGRPGLTSYMSLIQSPYPTNNLLVQDTTLVAANPTPFVDGIVGKGFTLRRVNIYGVVDSVKISGDNVLVESSWLHDNLYFLQDPNYGNTPTHDDNVQVQAGTNITIRGSVLEDTHNAAMMITQDAGRVSNLTFADNRVDNGACTINVAEKSYGPVAGLRITGSTFGLNMVRSRCAVSMPTTTSSISTVTGNLFTDGSVVGVTRG